MNADGALIFAAGWFVICDYLGYNVVTLLDEVEARR